MLWWFRDGVCLWVHRCPLREAWWFVLNSLLYCCIVDLSQSFISCLRAIQPPLPKTGADVPATPSTACFVCFPHRDYCVSIDGLLEPLSLKQMRVLWVTFRDNGDSSSYRSF